MNKELDKRVEEMGEKELKSTTNIVINTNRLYYGEKSTISAFLATAYDKYGCNVDSINGYFLEPETDYSRAKEEGSDKAIMYGTYDVVPKKAMKRLLEKEREKKGIKEKVFLKYQWYIANVPGRSGIAIHSGNYGDDTLGCLLPGCRYSYDKGGNDYAVSGSRIKTEELFSFFERYGKGGIKINIGL